MLIVSVTGFLTLPRQVAVSTNVRQHNYRRKKTSTIAGFEKHSNYSPETVIDSDAIDSE